MAEKYTERRRGVRVPCDLEVYVDRPDDIQLRSTDVSKSGMFVEMADPYPVGTRIFMRFTLSDSPIPIRTYARVVRRVTEEKNGNTEKTTVPGIGIEFLTLSEFDAKRLERFLDEVYGDLVDEIHIRSEDYTLMDFSSTSKDPLNLRAKKLFAYIEDMKAKGYHTYRRQLVSPTGNRVVIYDEVSKKEREMVMFGSNNYLGLSSHPKVIKAAEEAIEKYGVGAGSVSLLAGTFELHKKLERRLAEFKGCEDAIIFPSGYSTNVGCISALLREKDLVVIDRLAHASIIDGCILSRSKLRTFKHSDTAALEQVLERNKSVDDTILIAVDGVYSMDGDIAPLPDIMEIAKSYGAKVLVDDAHATGVIGERGKGTASHFGLEGKVDIVVGTLSKAIGQLGGFVASRKEIVNYLRYYARSYFFSTSLPPVVVASVLAALDIMENEPQIQQKLWENIIYFRENLKYLGFELVENTESAIVPIIIGDETLLKKMSRRLHEEGLYINPVPYPAVPRDRTRFRASVMATHTKEDLNFALETLEKVGLEFGVIGKKKKALYH